ncbi:SHOCT domain-containing protein [Bhargavaea massiliensis]
MGMFGGSFMMVGIMLFWVVLIAIGFYLLHRFINDRKEELSPIEILKVRLAKGEISLEEFERLSKKCE